MSNSADALLILQAVAEKMREANYEFYTVVEAKLANAVAMVVVKEIQQNMPFLLLEGKKVAKSIALSQLISEKMTASLKQFVDPEILKLVFDQVEKWVHIRLYLYVVGKNRVLEMSQLEEVDSYLPDDNMLLRFKFLINNPFLKNQFAEAVRRRVWQLVVGVNTEFVFADSEADRDQAKQVFEDESKRIIALYSEKLKRWGMRLVSINMIMTDRDFKAAMTEMIKEAGSRDYFGRADVARQLEKTAVAPKLCALEEQYAAKEEFFTREPLRRKFFLQRIRAAFSGGEEEDVDRAVAEFIRRWKLKIENLTITTVAVVNIGFLATPFILMMSSFLEREWLEFVKWGVVTTAGYFSLFLIKEITQTLGEEGALKWEKVKATFATRNS